MRPLDSLRVFTTSVRAALQGLLNLVTGRIARSDVRLAPGDEAPDFSLPGSDGRRYRLSDYRNRQAVVLAWFPKAFTGGCAAECRSLAHRPDLDARQVCYFAVSTDDPATNRQFAQSLGVNYPILSDEDRSVARAYGVLGAAGFPSRWTFIVGRDGRIAAIDKAVRVSSHGRDVAAAVARLDLSGPDERMGRSATLSGSGGQG
ncbi:MAG: peroxiredoxin [Vicinamibacterales bacterium]